MQTSFAGSWAALVTPFHHGNIDRESLVKLLDFHLAAKTDGLIICGTTGESATLSAPEKLDLMKACRDHVGNRLPLVFGTGGNNTRSAVELTAKAAEVGAQGVLVVTPYYNKPTQDGLKAHFQEIARATTLPVILYNVPGRTGVNMAAATTLELAKIPNIKAVKEASGNLDQVMDILRGAPGGFEVLSGDDALNFAILALGGKGVISVTANVAPKLMKAFTQAAGSSQWEEARRLHFELLDLHRALFIESNPIPAKTALHLMRLVNHEEFRLPLVKASAETRSRLQALLERMALLP
jgi:4-hydroxy-tetrahydrodipicolinate synthase